MKEINQIYLTDVNPYITCVLCKGYLVDATTITECLHTCNNISGVVIIQLNLFYRMF